jgi:hypothetical protein
VQIFGWGHYEANNGTLMEPMPDVGDFRWHAYWPYRAADDRSVTFASAPDQAIENHPAATFLLRPMIGVAMSPATGASEVSTALTIAQGAGGAGSVSVGPVGVPDPTQRTASEALTIPLRLQLNVTGGREPETPHAEATAEASAEASASVTVAVPERPPVPATETVYFAEEGRTEGDEGELVRRLFALPPAAQSAIRSGRLQVTAMGFASTTGTEARNRSVYSLRRAQWAQRIIARTFGIAPEAVHVAALGADTAPAADRAEPGGVPNPHERRVEIHFEETAPTTTVTTTSTDRDTDREHRSSGRSGRAARRGTGSP